MQMVSRQELPALWGAGVSDAFKHSVLLQRVAYRAIEQAVHERVPPWVFDQCIKGLRLERFDDPAGDHRKLIVAIDWWHGGRRRRIVAAEHVRFNVKLNIASKFQKGFEDPTAALKGSLSTRGELHHFRLNQHFPKRVREVVMEMNHEISEPIATVHFNNGHSLRRREAELMTTEFLALCAMIYDLPPKGRD
jgi:hypothetical protein